MMPHTKHNPLDKSLYKFWVKEHVRYADLEVQRHVNNMVIGVYFQSARIAMLSDLGIMWGTPEHAIVIARTTNNFYKEISYPKDLDCGAAVTRLGNTSFNMMFGVFSGDDCYASQEAIAIYWNPVTKEKRPLDDAVREKLSRYLVA
jgi:acyl-CoA thioester hydrolase